MESEIFFWGSFLWVAGDIFIIAWITTFFNIFVLGYVEGMGVCEYIQ